MSSNKTYRLSDSKVTDFIHVIRSKTVGLPEPVSFKLIERYGRDPFLILVACMLSLRTRDSVTWAASVRLFEQAKTPQELLKLTPYDLETLLFPVGFYRQKAFQLQKLSLILLQKYQGLVPENKQKLLALPGVGLKTANLVLGLAFGIPALCVDTHVHRLANKWGLVCTKTPEETERALTILISDIYWIELNKLLVIWGQCICTSRSRCSREQLCAACLSVVSSLR